MPPLIGGFLPVLRYDKSCMERVPYATKNAPSIGHFVPKPWAVGWQIWHQLNPDPTHHVVCSVTLLPGAVEETGGQDPVQSLLVEGGEKCQEMREVAGRGKVGQLRPLRLEAVLDKLCLEVANKDQAGERTITERQSTPTCSWSQSGGQSSAGRGTRCRLHINKNR